MNGKPLMYIHNTRTAGWGLIIYLSPVPHFYTINHSPISIYYDREYYTTFTTIRDPFTRVHSQYEFYKNRRKKLPYNLTFENFVLNYDYWASQPNLRFSLRTCFDFINVNGEVVVDHILRFEHLSEDYNKFAEQFDLPLNLPHEHKNELKSEYDISLYTQEMKDKIYEVFENDFKLYKQYVYNV